MKVAVVVLLIAAIFGQAFCAEVASSKDEAKKVFHQMMKVIEKALTQAQKALDKAMTTVTDKTTQIQAKAVAELDKVLNPLRTKLDNYVKKAEEKGFDVSTCQSYVDDFGKTPDNLVTNLVNCFSDQVRKAQGYVDDALKNAKQMESDLNNIDSDIDHCGGNAFKKAKCYAKIIEKIAKETKKAPQHIVEDVTKATALVTEILPNLETCSVNELKKAGKVASSDVAKFAVCAAL